MRVALETTDSTPGQAVVPGRLLLDVVRSLPKDDLTLEYRSAEQDVEVMSGPSKFHLRTLPTEDFPKLPEPPSEGSSDGAGRGVRRHDRPRGPRRLARRDAPAPHRRPRHRERQRAAHGRHRLLPAGREGDQARLGAERLARGERAGADASGAGPDRLGGRRETIGVAALENQVVFTVDDIVLSSRLVEGRFPNYQQLLPEAYEHELRVSRDELLEVVRRVGLLAQKNAPLRLRFSEGALDVSAQTPGRGRGERVAAGAVRRRGARDRVQPGVLPRGPRERGVGGAGPEADQPAAPGPDPVRATRTPGFRYLVMPIRLNV